MENLTDEKLIEKAKAGDENALDFLLAKYKRLACKIARSYFLIGAEYEDLVQEAMIGLYKAYMSYNSQNGASFSTFARQCITRNIQTAVKTANRKKNQMLNNSISLSNQGSVVVHSEKDDEDINLIIPSNMLPPDEKLIENEKLNYIKEKIKNVLSKLELEVLINYLNGNSYTQIAKKMNMSNKSVDNALSRVRQKLSFLKNQ